jgi:hypothetical protein
MLLSVALLLLVCRLREDRVGNMEEGHRIDVASLPQYFHRPNGHLVDERKTQLWRGRILYGIHNWGFGALLLIIICT